MDNQQEKFDLKMAWLAALIEGEGWISLGKANSQQRNGTKTMFYFPQIGVVNTDKLIIDEVRMLFEILGIKYRFQEKKSHCGSDGITRKARWEVSLSAIESIIKLSDAILPYMIGEKKNRLHKVLKFLVIRKIKGKGPKGKYGNEEEELYKELYSYKGKSRSKILNDYTPNT